MHVLHLNITADGEPPRRLPTAIHFGGTKGTRPPTLTYTWEYGGVRDTERVAVLYRRPGYTDEDIEDAKQEITSSRSSYAQKAKHASTK